MNLLIYCGALLVAVLALSLPALCHRCHYTILRKAWRDPLRLMFAVLTEELGAVTVYYYARAGGVTLEGSTTGPTATQAAQCPMIKAKVVFGVTADAQALITHNWGLDASAPGYYDPEIQWYQISDGTYMPSLTFDVANTNVVNVNKLGTNAPTTVIVILRKGSIGSGPWQ